MSTHIYRLAQYNIAKMKAPLSDPLMKEFVDLLAPINDIADKSPGFVWRMQDYEGDATSIRAYDDELILVNMSVWESVRALYDYTYKSHHFGVIRDRKKWFDKRDGPAYVLWWISAGHIPTVEEGKERLEHLEKYGSSAYAFDFKNTHEPEVEANCSNLMSSCPEGNG